MHNNILTPIPLYQEAMRSRQTAERLGVEKAHMLEFQQFTMVWDRKMNEYDINAHELVEVCMFATHIPLLTSPPLTSPLPSLHSSVLHSYQSFPHFSTSLSLVSSPFHTTLLNFPLITPPSSLLPLGYERQTQIRAPSTSQSTIRKTAPTKIFN
jgi:hypothetical protein